MRRREEIELKIKDLVEQTASLNTDRNDEKERYGGISEEVNNDYFSDIAYIIAQTEALQWVLKVT